MTSKKLIPLVIVAVVAVLIIIISEHLANKQPSDNSQKFFNEKIGSFIVKKEGVSVTLHKRGDVWFVSPGVKKPDGTVSQPLGADASSKVSIPDYATDSATVTIALEKLSSMRKGDLASKNQEKQILFEVDTAIGLTVEVFGLTGSPIGSVIIGKSTPDWNSNYVREMGSNDVYKVSGGIGYSFFTDKDRWRDKVMMSFDKSLAKTITLVKKNGSSVSLAKADTGNIWNIVAPEQSPAKSTEVDAILSSLSGLSAASFQDSIQPDTVLGFLKPELTVAIGLKNGSKKIAVGSKLTDGRYYAMVDGKETVYIINEGSFNGMNKDLSALKDTPVQSTPAPAKKK